MSKFHSTVSRRTFMKGLGLGAAGLGAAAAAAPVFHDLDEVISSPIAGRKRAWWIKDTDEPKSLEIDWSQVVRSDKTINGHAGVGYAPSLMRTIEGGAADKYTSAGRQIVVPFWQRKFPHLNWQGDTTRDVALHQAASKCRLRTGAGWLGYQKTVPPQEQNYAQLGPMPKWTGTPEENFRMIRNVGVLCGASVVGAIKLDQNTRKFFNKNEGSGRDIVFEDEDMAYETTEGGTSGKGKKVIPNGWSWLIYHLYIAQTEMAKRFPALLARSALDILGTYQAHGGIITQEFLRAIGYHSLRAPANTMPLGVFAGVGEHSRMGYNVVSPEYGATARRVNLIVTNLPLAPTKPVDAGIARFCLTCKLCGEKACPFDALQLGDPSWDHTVIPGSPPGFKGWRMITPKCAHCGSACQGVCPFNSVRESFVHEFVNATVSTTSIFNGFFRQMEETFVYGPQNPETWWELDNEPAYGYHPRMLMPSQRL